MLEVKKSAIRFDSASGADTVAGYFYEQPGTAPRAIVQLSHGMCEYVGRYDDFAGFLVKTGTPCAETTIWAMAPPAERTVWTDILPHRTGANMCCRICTA